MSTWKKVASVVCIAVLTLCGNVLPAAAATVIKMRPIKIELKKNCETPIYFQYEADRLIEKLPELKAELTQMKQLDYVLVTYAEPFRAELFSGRHRIALLEDSGQYASLFDVKYATLFTKKFSYKTDNGILTYIQARFPLYYEDVKDICYQVQLIVSGTSYAPRNVWNRSEP